MSTLLYATDLTDAEWDFIQPLLPTQPHPGRPRQHPWRTLLNAIFYHLRTGGAWVSGRFLPQEWTPWQTV
jgi:transposase